MELRVYKSNDFSPELIGTLFDDGSFAYAPEYLANPAARAISFSLPLRPEPYAEAEAAPYFKGLLPEGAALAKLAHATGYRPTDYLQLLATCGLDCVGDIVINPEAFANAAYESLDADSEALLSGRRTVPPAYTQQAGMYVNGDSRLSLAGTQDKIGLYRNYAAPDEESRRVWYRPVGGAPSNTIVKFPGEELPELMVNEQLVMVAARACGVSCAETELLPVGRGALAVRRFDRMEPGATRISGMLAPLRRHQEDFAQIFGRLPNGGEKYAELEGGTIRAISAFLRANSEAPALDVREFARVCLCNFAIGNCDNHLKNTSVLYAKDWGSLRLAPAYDLVSTTYYARFSTTMRMRMGTTREIGDVTPDDLRGVAEDLGVTEAFLRKVAGEVASRLVPGLRAEAARLEAHGFDFAYYLADNMEEEWAPRIEVLSAFAGTVARR